MIPKLSALIHDQSGQAVQIGNSFQTSDGSTWTSPMSLTGGIDTLVVPQGAVECILFPASNDLNVSELSSLASYDSIVKGSKEEVPCAMTENIYLQGTASDVVYFRFTIV